MLSLYLMPPQIKASCLINTHPHDNYSKICLLNLVICQVQSKNRLLMTTQRPWVRILTLMSRFKKVMWISRWPRHINWWSGYSAIFLLFWYFCLKHISFFELVIVMRINAFYLLKSPLLDPEIQINAPCIH